MDNVSDVSLCNDFTPWDSIFIGEMVLPDYKQK